MNRTDRDSGGAIAAIVVLLLILLVVVVGGGGLFFFVAMQRAAQLQAMMRAELAQQRAILVAEQAREMAARQQVEANLAADQLRAHTEAARAAEFNAAEFNAEEESAAGDDSPAEQGQSSEQSQPATALDRLAWMVNHWQKTEGAASSEEHWIAARGGMMLGVNRSVNQQGKASFEFLRIQLSDDDQLSYYASPSGRGETEFPAVEVGEQRVVFENPAHDFPQRITYWLDEQGHLNARIEGKTNGQSASMQWSWSAAH